MLGQLAWTLGGVALCVLAAYRREWALAFLIVASALREQAVIAVGPVHTTWFTALLTVTVVAWLVSEVRTRGRAGAPFGPLAWALVLFPLAGLWSLATSIAQQRTLSYTLSLVSLLLFAWLYARFAAEKPDGRRYAAVYVITSLGLSVVAFVQALFPSLGMGYMSFQGINTQTYMIRPAAFYLDPNFLGGHLTIAVLLAIGLASGQDVVRRRWLWTGASVVIAFGVGITYSRTAWLALVLGFVVLAVGLPKGRRRIPVVALALILVAAIVAFPIVKWRFITGAKGSSSETRMLMYVSAFEMVRDHPIAGVGLEAFQVAYPDYRDPAAQVQIKHPHQVPVALVSETGLAGLIAQLAVAAAIVVTFLRRRARGWDSYDAALLAAFLGLLFGTFFQFYLYFPAMWLIAGLSAAGTGPFRGSGFQASLAETGAGDGDVAAGTLT